VYAVIEQLRKRQPVAVQVSWGDRPDAYILLLKDGVTEHECTDLAIEDHVPDLWAFSDSRLSVQIPTSAFLDTLGVWVFQTTSPAEKRWKNWTKERQVQLYIMDLWSVEEIRDLVYVVLVIAAQLSDQAAPLASFSTTAVMPWSASKHS
jgi:hypothetical protein